MTYLELVEMLRVEADVGGDVLTTVQPGLMGKGIVPHLASMIQRAWNDIQNKHRGEWDFMRISTVHIVPANTSLQFFNEHQAKLVRRYDLGTFRLALATEGLPQSQELPFLSYPEFQMDKAPTLSSYARPDCFTVRKSDQALFLGPATDQQYQLWYDYWSRAVMLSADADVPLLPDPSLHPVIVWKALKDYGRFDLAPDVIARAQERYDEAMTEIEMDFLPDVTQGYWGQ